MSDKISCRLEADVSQALRSYLEAHPGATVSGVVAAALRAYLLGASADPAIPAAGPDVWEAIATIERRLAALEPPRTAPRQPSPQPKPITATLSPAAGLLSDTDVAERLGRSRRGFQNSVRAAGLKDGDTYEGYRIVGKVPDPQLGGPPRRVWEPVTDEPA